MVVIMAAAILGASVDTGALPTIVHAWLAYGGIVCNLAAAKIEIDAINGIRARRAGSEPASELVTPLVELSSVIKNYQGLRPLRRGLARDRAARDRVALHRHRSGDRAGSCESHHGSHSSGYRHQSPYSAAPTSSLADGADWLSLIERIGIVSERAVLLDALTVIQNLAMPFSLDIEPPPPELRANVPRRLPREVGLG